MMRPVLVSVDTRVHGDAVEAEVTMKIGDGVVTGHAMRPAGGTDEAVAAATLRGIYDATGVVLHTLAAAERSVVDVPLAVVLIEVPALAATLAGCVTISDPNDQTVYAKAALDAINRLVCSPQLLRELASRSSYVV